MRCISLIAGKMLAIALAAPSAIHAEAPLRVAGAPPASSTGVLVEPSANVAQDAVQEITLSGLVTDAATLQPLSGAQVTVVGTDLRALTGEAGRYGIVGVPVGASAVRVSMIGYAQQEQIVQFAAGQAVTLDVQLQAQAIELEGIVAVGYGTRRQKTLTGSVSAASGDVIAAAPAVNTSNSLGGRLAGIASSTSSGEPGNDNSTLRIRGDQTLNKQQPADRRGWRAGPRGRPQPAQPAGHREH